MPSFDLKALLDKMKAGPVPVTQPQINPNITPRPTQLDPNLPLDQPARDFSQSITKQPATPIRIHIGSDQSLQGLDRKIADLNTEQQAAKDFPSSKVVNGEILPPKMHHGLGDKLKSIGKGIVINMGEYAKTHPDASGAELLSAGGAGGVVGGVSPVSIDALQGQAQLARDERDVQNQIGLEGERARIEQTKQGPLHVPILKTRSVAEGEYDLPEGTEIRQQIDPRTGRATDVIGPDNKPVVERRPKPTSANTRNPLIHERKNADGSTTVLQSDDQGKTWREVRDLGSAAPKEKPQGETPTQRRERQARYRAAQQLLNDLGEQEKAAAAAKDQAWKEYQAAKGRYSENADIQPDVIAAKEAVDKAQAHYESFWTKKNDAKADMEQYKDPDEQTSNSRSGLTIEGAIEAFKKKKKRNPSEQEIANMQAALNQ